MGTSLKQGRPLLWEPLGVGTCPFHACCRVPGLFSRCSGDVCAVRAFMHLLQHLVLDKEVKC